MRTYRRFRETAHAAKCLRCKRNVRATYRGTQAERTGWFTELQGRGAMPGQRDLDRENDARLLTPLLLMATILVIGILIFAFTGHSLAAG
jgi:hypothetical protein